MGNKQGQAKAGAQGGRRNRKDAALDRGGKAGVQQVEVKLSQNLIDKLTMAFNKIDTDGNGTLSQQEIVQAFSKANGRTSRGLNFFNQMNVENKGDITKDEFFQFWKQFKTAGATEDAIFTELQTLLDQEMFIEQLNRISTSKLDFRAISVRAENKNPSAPKETREQIMKRKVDEQVAEKYNQAVDAYEEHQRWQQSKLASLNKQIEDTKQEIPDLLKSLQGSSSKWDDHEDEKFRHQAKMLNTEQYRLCEEHDALEKAIFELEINSKGHDQAMENCIDMHLDVLARQEEKRSAQLYLSGRLDGCVEIVDEDRNECMETINGNNIAEADE